jgi:hypothetical protein
MEIWWTKLVDTDLTSGRDASQSLGAVQKCLSLLSDSVLREQPPLRRRKIENLVGSRARIPIAFPLAKFCPLPDH